MEFVAVNALIQCLKTHRVDVEKGTSERNDVL